jgi:hypothetical protein
MDRLFNPARLLLGLLLVANGLNHFAGPFLPLPQGTAPLAVQLQDALYFSQLINVAMGLQLAAGLALLAGLFMPLALAASMPVNLCALYWALVLEHSVGWSLLAALVVGMGALLMFALLPAYTCMLTPRGFALGERADNGANFETVYAWPVGQSRPLAFVASLVPLLAAASFYHFIVPSLLAFFCIVVLAWPLTVLLLRLVQGLVVKEGG